MKTLRQWWERIRPFWLKVHAKEAEKAASRPVRLPEDESHNGKKKPPCDERMIALLVAVLALPSCATAPDGMRGVFGTDRLEHPDSVFHKAARDMMLDD